MCLLVTSGEGEGKGNAEFLGDLKRIDLGTNIGLNVIRPIISRNLSDMSRYTRAMGRFMDLV